MKAMLGLVNGLVTTRNIRIQEVCRMQNGITRTWLVITLLVTSMVAPGLSESVYYFAASGDEAKETCYHYCLAVAIVSPKGFLPIQIVDVWRQGERLRVEERGKWVYLKTPQRSALIESQAKRGWVSDKENSLVGAAAGVAFLMAEALLTTDYPKSEPLSTETIEERSCGIFEVGEAPARILVWIPLKQQDIPSGFLKARVELLGGQVVVQARLVVAEQLSARPHRFFEVDKDISLTEVDALDAAILVMKRWEEELGLSMCTLQDSSVESTKRE